MQAVVLNDMGEQAFIALHRLARLRVVKKKHVCVRIGIFQLAQCIGKCKKFNLGLCIVIISQATVEIKVKKHA